MHHSITINGIYYPTLKQALHDFHSNVSSSLLQARLRDGVDPLVAITTPAHGLRNIRCKDHLGNEFDTMTAMCRFWNVERARFIYRIKNGWSIKNALTTPARKMKISKCT